MKLVKCCRCMNVLPKKKREAIILCVLSRASPMSNTARAMTPWLWSLLEYSFHAMTIVNASSLLPVRRWWQNAGQGEALLSFSSCSTCLEAQGRGRLWGMKRRQGWHFAFAAASYEDLGFEQEVIVLLVVLLVSPSRLCASSKAALNGWKWQLGWSLKRFASLAQCSSSKAGRSHTYYYACSKMHCSSAAFGVARMKAIGHENSHGWCISFHDLSQNAQAWVSHASNGSTTQHLTALETQKK